MRDLIEVFKILSDETRLRILMLLMEKELCVCEIEAALDMAQSRVSHQLRNLKNVGLIKDRREGTWVYYSLNSNGLDSFNKSVIELLSKKLKSDPTVLKDYDSLERVIQADVRRKCQLAKAE